MQMHRSKTALLTMLMTATGLVAGTTAAGAHPVDDQWVADEWVADDWVQDDWVVDDWAHDGWGVDDWVADIDSLALLRACESGDDYGADTGNGYYGAYQFSEWTWWSLGYGGFPHEASPEVQDEAASLLASSAGWSSWPGCAYALGLY